MSTQAPIAQAAEVQTVPIVFSGGHDTDRRDHGRPKSGRLWRNRPAESVAIIRNGKVLELKITNPGSGYGSSQQSPSQVTC